MPSLPAVIDIGPGLERTVLVLLNVVQVAFMAWLTARYEINASRRRNGSGTRVSDRG